MLRATALPVLMLAALGAQIVVENRAAAGGVIGMKRMKTASAGDWTLVAAAAAAMTVILDLRTNLPDDPQQASARFVAVEPENMGEAVRTANP